MSKKTILKKGYTITVKSWENDEDIIVDLIKF